MKPCSVCGRADASVLHHDSGWHDSGDIFEILECWRIGQQRAVAALGALLALPVAVKELEYLDRGIGTATKAKAWLEARAVAVEVIPQPVDPEAMLYRCPKCGSLYEAGPGALVEPSCCGQKIPSVKPGPLPTGP